MPSHGPPREAAPRGSWPCRQGAGVHPCAAPVPRRDVACALAGGRRSPVVSAGGGRAGRRGPGPFSACGGWVAPGRPRRIWRRLEPGPSPPTRRQEPARRRKPRTVPTDLVGHGAEQQVAAEAPAAAAATEGCGGCEGEVGRGGGSRGERESVVFFILFYSRKPWFERGA